MSKSKKTEVTVEENVEVKKIVASKAVSDLPLEAAVEAPVAKGATSASEPESPVCTVERFCLMAQSPETRAALAAYKAAGGSMSVRRPPSQWRLILQVGQSRPA